MLEVEEKNAVICIIKMAEIHNGKKKSHKNKMENQAIKTKHRYTKSPEKIYSFTNSDHLVESMTNNTQMQTPNSNQYRCEFSHAGSFIPLVKKHDTVKEINDPTSPKCSRQSRHKHVATESEVKKRTISSGQPIVEEYQKGSPLRKHSGRVKKKSAHNLKHKRSPRSNDQRRRKGTSPSDSWNLEMNTNTQHVSEELSPKPNRISKNDNCFKRIGSWLKNNFLKMLSLHENDNPVSLEVMDEPSESERQKLNKTDKHERKAFQQEIQNSYSEVGKDVAKVSKKLLQVSASCKKNSKKCDMFPLDNQKVASRYNKVHKSSSPKTLRRQLENNSNFSVNKGSPEVITPRMSKKEHKYQINETSGKPVPSKTSKRKLQNHQIYYVNPEISENLKSNTIADKMRQSKSLSPTPSKRHISNNYKVLGSPIIFRELIVNSSSISGNASLSPKPSTKNEIKTDKSNESPTAPESLHIKDKDKLMCTFLASHTDNNRRKSNLSSKRKDKVLHDSTTTRKPKRTLKNNVQVSRSPTESKQFISHNKKQSYIIEENDKSYKECFTQEESKISVSPKHCGEILSSAESISINGANSYCKLRARYEINKYKSKNGKYSKKANVKDHKDSIIVLDTRQMKKIPIRPTNNKNSNENNSDLLSLDNKSEIRSLKNSKKKSIRSANNDTIPQKTEENVVESNKITYPSGKVCNKKGKQHTDKRKLKSSEVHRTNNKCDKTHTTEKKYIEKPTMKKVDDTGFINENGNYANLQADSFHSLNLRSNEEAETQQVPLKITEIPTIYCVTGTILNTHLQNANGDVNNNILEKGKEDEIDINAVHSRLEEYDSEKLVSENPMCTVKDTSPECYMVPEVGDMDSTKTCRGESQKPSPRLYAEKITNTSNNKGICTMSSSGYMPSIEFPEDICVDTDTPEKLMLQSEKNATDEIKCCSAEISTLLNEHHLEEDKNNILISKPPIGKRFEQNFRKTSSVTDGILTNQCQATTYLMKTSHENLKSGQMHSVFTAERNSFKECKAVHNSHSPFKNEKHDITRSLSAPNQSDQTVVVYDQKNHAEPGISDSEQNMLTESDMKNNKIHNAIIRNRACSSTVLRCNPLEITNFERNASTRTSKSSSTKVRMNPITKLEMYKCLKNVVTFLIYTLETKTNNQTCNQICLPSQNVLPHVPSEPDSLVNNTIQDYMKPNLAADNNECLYFTSVGNNSNNSSRSFELFSEEFPKSDKCIDIVANNRTKNNDKDEKRKNKDTFTSTQSLPDNLQLPHTVSSVQDVNKKRSTIQGIHEKGTVEIKDNCKPSPLEQIPDSSDIPDNTFETAETLSDRNTKDKVTDLNTGSSDKKENMPATKKKFKSENKKNKFAGKKIKTHSCNLNSTNIQLNDSEQRELIPDPPEDFKIEECFESWWTYIQNHNNTGIVEKETDSLSAKLFTLTTTDTENSVNSERNNEYQEMQQMGYKPKWQGNKRFSSISLPMVIIKSSLSPFTSKTDLPKRHDCLGQRGLRRDWSQTITVPSAKVPFTDRDIRVMNSSNLLRSDSITSKKIEPLNGKRSSVFKSASPRYTGTVKKKENDVSVHPQSKNKPGDMKRFPIKCSNSSLKYKEIHPVIYKIHKAKEVCDNTQPNNGQQCMGPVLNSKKENEETQSVISQGSRQVSQRGREGGNSDSRSIHESKKTICRQNFAKEEVESVYSQEKELSYDSQSPISKESYGKSYTKKKANNCVYSVSQESRQTPHKTKSLTKKGSKLKLYKSKGDAESVINKECKTKPTGKYKYATKAENSQQTIETSTTNDKKIKDLQTNRARQCTIGKLNAERAKAKATDICLDNISPSTGVIRSCNYPQKPKNVIQRKKSKPQIPSKSENKLKRPYMPLIKQTSPKKKPLNKSKDSNSTLVINKNLLDNKSLEPLFENMNIESNSHKKDEKVDEKEPSRNISEEALTTCLNDKNVDENHSVGSSHAANINNQKSESRIPTLDKTEKNNRDILNTHFEINTEHLFPELHSKLDQSSETNCASNTNKCIKESPQNLDSQIYSVVSKTESIQHYMTSHESKANMPELQGYSTEKLAKTGDNGLTTDKSSRTINSEQTIETSTTNDKKIKDLQTNRARQCTIGKLNAERAKAKATDICLDNISPSTGVIRSCNYPQKPKNVIQRKKSKPQIPSKSENKLKRPYMPLIKQTSPKKKPLNKSKDSNSTLVINKNLLDNKSLEPLFENMNIESNSHKKDEKVDEKEPSRNISEEALTTCLNDKNVDENHSVGSSHAANINNQKSESRIPTLDKTEKNNRDILNTHFEINTEHLFPELHSKLDQSSETNCASNTNKCIKESPQNLDSQIYSVVSKTESIQHYMTSHESKANMPELQGYSTEKLAKTGDNGLTTDKSSRTINSEQTIETSTTNDKKIKDLQTNRARQCTIGKLNAERAKAKATDICLDNISPSTGIIRSCNYPRKPKNVIQRKKSKPQIPSKSENKLKRPYMPLIKQTSPKKKPLNKSKDSNSTLVINKNLLDNKSLEPLFENMNIESNSHKKDEKVDETEPSRNISEEAWTTCLNDKNVDENHSVGSSHAANINNQKSESRIPTLDKTEKNNRDILNTHFEINTEHLFPELHSKLDQSSETNCASNTNKCIKESPQNLDSQIYSVVSKTESIQHYMTSHESKANMPELQGYSTEKLAKTGDNGLTTDKSSRTINSEDRKVLSAFKGKKFEECKCRECNEVLKENIFYFLSCIKQKCTSERSGENSEDPIQLPVLTIHSSRYLIDVIDCKVNQTEERTACKSKSYSCKNENSKGVEDKEKLGHKSLSSELMVLHSVDEENKDFQVDQFLTTNMDNVDVTKEKYPSRNQTDIRERTSVFNIYLNPPLHTRKSENSVVVHKNLSKGNIGTIEHILSRDGILSTVHHVLLNEDESSTGQIDERTVNSIESMNINFTDIKSKNTPVNTINPTHDFKNNIIIEGHITNDKLSKFNLRKGGLEPEGSKNKSNPENIEFMEEAIDITNIESINAQPRKEFMASTSQSSHSVVHDNIQSIKNNTTKDVIIGHLKEEPQTHNVSVSSLSTHCNDKRLYKNKTNRGTSVVRKDSTNDDITDRESHYKTVNDSSVSYNKNKKLDNFQTGRSGRETNNTMLNDLSPIVIDKKAELIEDTLKRRDFKVQRTELLLPLTPLKDNQFPLSNLQLYIVTENKNTRRESSPLQDPTQKRGSHSPPASRGISSSVKSKARHGSVSPTKHEQNKMVQNYLPLKIEVQLSPGKQGPIKPSKTKIPVTEWDKEMYEVTSQEELSVLNTLPKEYPGIFTPEKSGSAEGIERERRPSFSQDKKISFGRDSRDQRPPSSLSVLSTVSTGSEPYSNDFEMESTMEIQREFEPDKPKKKSKFFSTFKNLCRKKRKQSDAYRKFEEQHRLSDETSKGTKVKFSRDEVAAMIGYTEHKSKEKREIIYNIDSWEVGNTLRQGFRPDGLSLSGQICIGNNREVLETDPPTISICDSEDPATFLYRLGINVDKAEAMFVKDKNLNGRIHAALREASIWTDKVTKIQAILLLHLAQKAKPEVLGWYPNLVEAIVNYRINSAKQINGFLESLENLEEEKVQATRISTASYRARTSTSPTASYHARTSTSPTASYHARTSTSPMDLEYSEYPRKSDGSTDLNVRYRKRSYSFQRNSKA